MRGAIANGDRIIELRNAAALTQEMLAACAECDAKTLRSAERSNRLDIATLRRIAACFGVDVREIISRTDEAPSENIDPVMRYIRAFNARDPNALAEAFLEDGTVIVMADPALPGTGSFSGRDEIREWARLCFATYRAESVTEGMYDIHPAGDVIYVRLKQPTLEYLPNGNSASVSVVSEFQIRDRTIATLRIYPESGTIERMAFTTES